MFKNNYAHDVHIFNPEGRLCQVDFAMQAVMKGSPTIGLKNKNMVVLITQNTGQNLLFWGEKNQLRCITEHIGMSFAGIQTDANELAKLMRTICLADEQTLQSPYPVTRLVPKLSQILQLPSQKSGKRPFGVGLLLAGYQDSNGPHLYRALPDATVFECNAIAIGANTRLAAKYLMQNLQRFPKCSMDELIYHGIQALRTVSTFDNAKSKISIALVGKNQPFKILAQSESLQYLSSAKKCSMPEVEDSESDDDFD